MKLRRLLLTTAIGLTACASLPPPSLPRSTLREFAMDARFALRLAVPGETPQSSGGRINWQHLEAGDNILLANPIGVGIAEIEASPKGARLRTADGRVFSADDPDRLVGEITGQPLPIRRIPDWLLGRTGAQGRIELDPLGRPQHLAEAGWQIDYQYESDTADATPSRLTIRHGNEIELRLRIEEWKNTP